MRSGSFTDFFAFFPSALFAFSRISLFLFSNLLSIDWPLSFCSFTLVLPLSALSISGLCLCIALRDQIRFTPGLNVCSHGLLHLKGNSFSWNIGVQFKTRLMLANFTPLSCKMFPLLHTSIADGKRAHATL